MTERRRVLVTGAGGFIGRWSVPRLISMGYDVHAVVGRGRGRGSGERAVPPQLAQATLHRVDLLDAREADELMRRVAPSHWLNFAWIATPGVYWTSADNDRWLQSCTTLLQPFLEVGGRRVVMSGTCAEYDWNCAGVCHEGGALAGRDSMAPLTPYVRTKLAMHENLEAFCAAHALSMAWGRIFFQYGPAEHAERLVASVITKLLAGREAECSHGRQVRSFLHVSDVGEAFAALLDSDLEGAVNIGSGDAVRIADVLLEVGRQLDRTALIRFGARSAPAAEPPLLVPDIARLRDELSWQPRWSLPAGIADSIAWWRSRATEEL